MRRSVSGLHRDEGGQAIVLIAITMLALVMMVGLAIDAGQLFVARRTAQEAADAAAYAGAVVHYERTVAGSGIDTAVAIAAAYTDAALNGFVDGVGGVTVVARVPTSGLYSGNTRYVEVIITEQVRTSIVPGGALTNVSVRAVAGSEPLNNAYAIMALDRASTSCAFSTSPNADVHLTGGGIQVNSSSSTAACNQQTTASRFTIDPAPPHGIDINGGTSSTWPPGMQVDTSEPAQADPFAGTPPPLTTGCDPRAPGDPCVVHNSIPGGSPTILDPGIWTVTLGPGGNSTLWLRPGTYILKAGINGSGNADVISMRPDTVPACVADCGVLIYNTHSGYPARFDPAIHTCGGLSLVGNAESDLRARTTGAYANFLVYQDPACANEMVIAGNGRFNGTGTIYLPSATFRFNGNPSTLNGSQLVANRVDIQNGNITINFNATTTAQPILPRLSE